MSNSPDLPEWLKYTYDDYLSTGYIYGVPPLRVATLNLDVIGWNRYDNYDARRLIVSMEIMRKDPMEYIVEMKIDNVNIRDLCIPRRMNDLTNVLAEQLGWKQKNGNKVVPVYMASAVDIGENRVPLRPNEAEGVVIYFASDKDFSPALKKLQVEISPLWKLRPCPRDMKRTSMERHFRRYTFLVDWCSFRLTSPSGVPSESNEQASSNKGTGGGSTSSQDGSSTSAQGTITGDGVVVDETMDLNQRYNNNDNGNGATNYAYHQINRQQQPTEDAMLISRDVIMKPSSQEPVILEHPPPSACGTMTLDREMMSTPLPPQYSETHPNGAPALTYAV